MNVIVLGKLHGGAIHVVECQDSEGFWSAIKYGNWAGRWDTDWYRYESASGDGYVKYHAFDQDFKLTDYPLVPVAYEGQYALVVLVEYEPDDDERLVKVGPASPKLVKETLADMWGR